MAFLKKALTLANQYANQWQLQHMRRIYKSIYNMNISILINIHHVDLALEYVDRIIGIRAGKIVYDGPAKNVTEEVLNTIYEGKLPEEA